VLKIIESIIEKGVVTRPYIGVTVQTVSDEASIYAAAGARVVSVTEDSPAKEAGLQENDIITAVD
jgi:serine protease Do